MRIRLGGAVNLARAALLTWVVLSASIVLCSALLLPSLARAQDVGEYGSVSLHKNEAPLMKTVTEYEDLFVRRGYRYGAPELEAMVSGIGERLAPASADPYIRYRFHILRDSEANAFALPDGQVYVNTGILAALENEAQLAGILAHEVHHTAGHHGILEYRSVRSKSISGMVLGPLTLGLSDVFLELSVYGHSREFEEEADRKGEPRMFEAGYDPREMSRVFEILQQDPEEEQPKTSTAWSTHPQLQKRSEYCREIAATLLKSGDPSTLRVEAAGYRRKVRRVSLQTVQDLIAGDYPRTALALASRLVSEDDADPESYVARGDALRALGARAAASGEHAATDKEKEANRKAREKETRNEREAERVATPEGKKALHEHLEAARQDYQRALAIDPDISGAHRGLGYVFQGLDKPQEAGQEFVIYLRANPQAVDRPVILGHLKTCTELIKRTSAHEQEPKP